MLFSCVWKRVSLSYVWLFVTSTPGFPVLHYLLEFAQTHVHWFSDDIQLFQSLLPLLFLPLIFPGIMVFSSESALRIRWPKYWSSASAPVLPMNSQAWFPLGLTDLSSLPSKGLSRVFSSTIIWKRQFLDGRFVEFYSNCPLINQTSFIDLYSCPHPPPPLIDSGIVPC